MKRDHGGGTIAEIVRMMHRYKMTRGEAERVVIKQQREARERQEVKRQAKGSELNGLFGRLK